MNTAAPQPKPAASAAAQVAVPAKGTKLRCMLRAQVRAGHEMGSATAGELKVGETVEILETKVLQPAGTVRCRFARGWVSMRTGAGKTILQKIAAPASMFPTATRPAGTGAALGMAERIKAEKKTSKFDILSLGKGMASAISCPCCFPGAEGDATRVEFAHLLRGWVDGPGVLGCDARALAAMDAVLEVCEAMPRFCVGDKVELNADGEKYSRGQIVAHWWRHPTWEADAPAAIYQVQLEDDGSELGGELIFATKDIDACLRAV